MNYFNQPKRIPVKTQWDPAEQRIKLLDSKGNIVKTIYCNSSLSVFYNGEMLDGRVEKSFEGFPESKGYYFLEEGIKLPLTNDFHYYVWVEEDETAIVNYERIVEAIKYYDNKSLL